jgi:hypothetical protein
MRTFATQYFSRVLKGLVKGADTASVAVAGEGEAEVELIEVEAPADETKEEE